MAHQRAVTVQGSCADVLNLPTDGGRHVSGVEINHVRHIGDAVRIVAGCAGGLVLYDVRAVELETLVGQDAVPAMAFVA